jgi:hypothetical protein
MYNNENLSSDKLMIAEIINSTQNQYSILFRIARFIEEKYNFSHANNWDYDFSALNHEERLFYKTWNWFANCEKRCIFMCVKWYNSM